MNKPIIDKKILNQPFYDGTNTENIRFLKHCDVLNTDVCLYKDKLYFISENNYDDETLDFDIFRRNGYGFHGDYAKKFAYNELAAQLIKKLELDKIVCIGLGSASIFDALKGYDISKVCVEISPVVRELNEAFYLDRLLDIELIIGDGNKYVSKINKYNKNSIIFFDNYNDEFEGQEDAIINSVKMFDYCLINYFIGNGASLKGLTRTLIDNGTENLIMTPLRHGFKSNTPLLFTGNSLIIASKYRDLYKTLRLYNQDEVRFVRKY